MESREEERERLLRQARAWRSKAEELRTTGECTRSPAARAILLRLAADRDRLAANAERRLAEEFGAKRA